MIKQRLKYYNREILQNLSTITSYIEDISKKKNNSAESISNPTLKLYTKTYDNSNEAVHNKVLYFPNKLFGWKYWRCYTPFTKTNCEVENPSIAVSQDGYTWTIPNKTSNPIDIPENNAKGFNSDPHLVFNSLSNTLDCWYRFCLFEGGEFIYRKVSKDGIKWSPKELMQSSKNTFQSLVCPVIIFKDNKYLIWILTNDNDSFKHGSYIKYYESNNGSNWSFIRDIKVRIEPDHMPWHFDIEIFKNSYHMAYSTRAISDYNNLSFIAYAYSKDNINYKSSILLKKSNQWHRWDNHKMHRPSLTFANEKCLLFYSAQNRFYHWGTGVVNISSILINK